MQPGKQQLRQRNEPIYCKCNNVRTLEKQDSLIGWKINLFSDIGALRELCIFSCGHSVFFCFVLLFSWSCISVTLLLRT